MTNVMTSINLDLTGRGILVVDDESSMRELLSIMLQGQGFQVYAAENGEDAFKLYQEEKENIDLVIHDLRMPGEGGIKLLRNLKNESPDLPVIVITAFSTWDNAVEAMRLGAYDYIRKPFDTNVVRSIVCRAIEQRLILQNSPEGVRDDLSYKSEIIGNNPHMQDVFDMIKRIAPTDSTIMIQGQSGTGKELVARSIHYRSYRREKTFLSVNCSAFTESLLESELFGHIKGSFTGAHEDKEGLFKSADQGTLFLDEVADMSLTTQVKILRVLEERKICPVGANVSEPIDVRIIAATNKNIEEEVEKGNFREDLYYRLNVIPLYLPSLKERKDDIPLLAGYFLAKYSRMMKKNVDHLSKEAQQQLQEHDWPGNVRELENIIQRQVALARGPQIEGIEFRRTYHARPMGVPRQEAPEPTKEAPRSVERLVIPDNGFSLEEHLQDYERRYLQEALKKTGGNLTNAAKLLGMSYRSFRYRVKKLKVKEFEYAEEYRAQEEMA